MTYSFRVVGPGYQILCGPRVIGQIAEVSREQVSAMTGALSPPAFPPAVLASVCEELGANVFGRLEYANRLLAERKFNEARMELQALTKFLPKVGP